MPIPPENRRYRPSCRYRRSIRPSGSTGFAVSSGRNAGRWYGPKWAVAGAARGGVAAGARPRSAGGGGAAAGYCPVEAGRVVGGAAEGGNDAAGCSWAFTGTLARATAPRSAMCSHLSWTTVESYHEWRPGIGGPPVAGEPVPPPDSTLIPAARGGTSRFFPRSASRIRPADLLARNAGAGQRAGWPWPGSPGPQMTKTTTSRDDRVTLAEIRFSGSARQHLDASPRDAPALRWSLPR